MADKPAAMPAAPRTTVVDNLSIPTHYVNQLMNVSYDGRNVLITFGEKRFSLSSPDKSEAHVVHRLALTPSVTNQLAQALPKILNAVAAGTPRVGTPLQAAKPLRKAKPTTPAPGSNSDKH